MALWASAASCRSRPLVFVTVVAVSGESHNLLVPNLLSSRLARGVQIFSSAGVPPSAAGGGFLFYEAKKRRVRPLNAGVWIPAKFFRVAFHTPGHVVAGSSMVQINPAGAYS